ncbi:hypothetical protein [Bacillus cereus]|uniref:hypothetical protein n=1 Tax=Bacillus cereus TaxID=1396 RepID=UPI0002793744|nr:hypothetical protein [Bacillus cereus]EJP85276.1 hypothetical protein IC3_04687 [Bacillus cereus VD142]
MISKLQIFVSTYLRNPNFRDLYVINREAAYQQLEIDEKSKVLIEKIDIKHLDESVKNLTSERFEKRKAEFQEFFHYLSKFVDIDVYFNLFLRKYPTGSVGREVEVERFVQFSTSYIKENKLPLVLIDLLIYCAKLTVLSDKPRENKNEYLENKNISFEDINTVKLLEPYEVIEFNYNVSQLLNDDLSIEQIMRITTSKTKFFIQKKYDLPTSCNVLEVDDEEFLNLIIENRKIKEILTKDTDERKENIQYLISEKIAIPT